MRERAEKAFRTVDNKSSKCELDKLLQRRTLQTGNGEFGCFDNATATDRVKQKLVLSSRAWFYVSIASIYGGG